MKKLILFSIMSIFLLTLISAADFTPQGDINLRGVYAIENATTINATGNISTISWFEGLFNWTISSIYFIWDGATLSFSESQLNATIDERAATQNTSMKNYVDEQNTSQINAMTDQNTSQTNYIGAVNISMGNYVDSQDIIFNTTMENYVGEVNTSMGNYADSQDIIFNDSVNNYIVDVNATQSNWVDNLFVRFTEIVDQVGNWTLDKVNYYTKTESNAINTSVTNSIADNNNSVTNALDNRYTKSEVNDINTSMNNYVVDYVRGVNVSVNNWIADNNASVVNHINLNNASMNNYIVAYVGIQNDSLVNYIAVQNGSIVNYIAEVNTSINNWIDDNNASVVNHININNESMGNYVLEVNATNFQTDTDTFVANYSDFLNKVDWGDVNNGTITAEETLWNANYSDFLNKIDWSNIINGTIWSDIGNGTMAKSSELNNGTYVIDSILNNGTYSVVNTDAESKCADAEYLAGNGTCTADLYEADTNTNAETECADAESYLGNGTCVDVIALDGDTTYTAGANLSLDGTTFSLDATNVKSWLDTVYAALADANPFGSKIDDTEMANEDFGEFTCTGNEDGCTLDSGTFDDEYIELGDNFVGEVTGTYGATVIGDDVLDDQYYDSEGDLTTLLDDNYEPISAAHFDATTINITCLNAACNWFTNATDSCMYWPSGGKDCGAA